MNIHNIQSKYNLNATASAMVNKIMGKRGQFTHIKYVRPLKLKKEFEGDNYGFKEVTGVFRLGVEYENLGTTKEKRDSGVSIGGMKGKEWVQYPYLLKSEVSDNLLVRVYGAKNTKVETRFFINGKAATPEMLNEMCLKSELNDAPKPIFDISLGYIKEIY
jgi:hypothetical protein